MSKHKVIFNKYIYRASMCVGFELDPADFLHCEDEEELTDAIYDVVYSETDTGDVQIKESEVELDMASFFEEWKSLKGLK